LKLYIFYIILIIIISIYNLFAFETKKSKTYDLLLDKLKKNKEKFLNENNRPKLQNSISKEGSKFRIHYDTIGVNKVDLIDNNKNGIPDYVDSVSYYFNYAYDILINKMGFQKPFIDSLRGGDNLYDVYLMELVEENDATYGYTDGEDLFTNEFGVNQLNSYIVIDNNFSPYDSITINGARKRAFRTYGIDAVKITSAHEFHHAIQFTYGIPIDYHGLLMEMSSVWVEYTLHPNIYDFVQYVSELFSDISSYKFTINTPDNGYRWSIFFQFIEKKYGYEFIKSIWEKVSLGKRFFDILEEQLKIKNNNLLSIWEEFIPYIYYTSNKSIDSIYFNSALKMPKLKLYRQESINDILNIKDKLEPFQIKLYRIFNNSNNDKHLESIDLLLSYAENDFYKNQYNIKDIDLIVSSNNLYNDKIPYCNNLSYLINNDGNNLIKYFFVNEGINYTEESFVMPNPINLSNDNLFISLPIDILNIDYEVYLYNSEMIQIYSKNIKASRYNGKYGVLLNEIKNISSGIYFYNVLNNQKNYFGKFVVKK
jgi:hypothetical protein